MVYVFLANGFEEIEALTPIDVLRRAQIEVESIGITGKKVIGAHNICVEADKDIDSFKENELEAIILPGGLKGTQNLDSSEFVKATVSNAFNAGKLVCAICAAPMILGKMGILQNKKATCYPGFEEYFINAEYTKADVIKDGNVITSNGMGSALEFAFEIVASLKGREIAEKIKKEIQY